LWARERGQRRSTRPLQLDDLQLGPGGTGPPGGPMGNQSWDTPWDAFRPNQGTGRKSWIVEPLPSSCHEPPFRPWILGMRPMASSGWFFQPGTQGGFQVHHVSPSLAELPLKPLQSRSFNLPAIGWLDGEKGLNKGRWRRPRATASSGPGEQCQQWPTGSQAIKKRGCRVGMELDSMVYTYPSALRRVG